jgi:hypothetical protein
MADYAALEAQLNDFDIQRRHEALDALCALAEEGGIALPEAGTRFNMHCHSFYSFNGYGLSPTALAWKGRREGLYAMGIVDFDVLDGVEEFLGACARLGIRACAGLETRVFVEPFATRVINSPGEPGIAYHMGAGFVPGAPAAAGQLAEFKSTANERTRELARRVGQHLDALGLDFDADVAPLTPQGNTTERHLCVALANKARERFPDEASCVAYLAEKLETAPAQVQAVLDDPPALQALIRAKTMKQGGVGYVRPEGPDFPGLGAVCEFARQNGALPTMTWLDGTSEGEGALDELMGVMLEAGVVAANIIPDRNWNIADEAARKVKVAHLHAFTAKCDEHDLPILVGTEMNAHGQRFVDDFDADPMREVTPSYLRGVHVFYGHTRLQAHAGMGYLSAWAQKHLPGAKAKNDFYEYLGKILDPRKGLDGIGPENAPESVLATLSR